MSKSDTAATEAVKKPRREQEFEITASDGNREETITVRTRSEVKGYVKAVAKFGFEVSEIVQVTKLDVSEFNDATETA